MSAWKSSIHEAGSSANWREKLPDLIGEISTWNKEIQPLVRKVSQGIRLSLQDGMLLYSYPNLSEIGRLANCVRTARFGKYAFFNSNVHVNQTNICVLSCKFCAFRRSKRADDAYALGVQSYLDDLAQYADYVDEVHTVGGLHPDWDVEHYETLFKASKKQFPHISIKALTAVEIKHISNLSQIS
ncbi:MAG: hypothetical protein HN923_08020, partial [Euryarchaeota archaeon]|nr:hypothetical protein [Euryarchaeota archaeon]